MRVQKLIDAVNPILTHVKAFIRTISPNTRKRIIWTLAVLFVLQIYFVRELIAAELLFSLVFAVLSTLAGICYVLGTIGERSFDWTETGVRVIAMSARRGYSALEELSKKPFRHPHSESVR
jgi:hypothetical protein